MGMFCTRVGSGPQPQQMDRPSCQLRAGLAKL